MKYAYKLSITSIPFNPGTPYQCSGVFVHYDFMYTTIASREPDESILRGGEIHAAFPSQSDLLLVVVLENS